MRLSPHFSLEELVASETAPRFGIDNAPPPAVRANLAVLAAALERVRAALGGHPVHVTSGYRCPALNARVRGDVNSRHLVGLAADVICPAFGPPLAICEAIVAAGIATDQVIHEFGHWCHVAVPAPGTRPRGELLTIARAAEGYRPGLHAV